MDFKVIHADGKVEEKTGKISLEQAQAAVGGYVEVVRLRQGFLLVDEDARLKGGQAVNETASCLAGQAILGDVVFLTKMSVLED
jgi:hypothetical protein